MEFGNNFNRKVSLSNLSLNYISLDILFATAKVIHSDEIIKCIEKHKKKYVELFMLINSLIYFNIDIDSIYYIKNIYFQIMHRPLYLIYSDRELPCSRVYKKKKIDYELREKLDKELEEYQPINKSDK